MKMTTYRAQQHNSTSRNRVKYFHVLKKIPLVPQVHTVDIPDNAITTWINWSDSLIYDFRRGAYNMPLLQNGYADRKF